MMTPVARLLIGGSLLLVCGLLFVVRGLVQGNSTEVVLGIPGFLVGHGALVFYKIEGDEQNPR
jgi:hypothetical protein